MAGDLMKPTGAETKKNPLVEEILTIVASENLEGPALVARLRELAEERAKGDEEVTKLLIRAALTARSDQLKQETDQAAGKAQKTVEATQLIRAKVDGHVQGELGTFSL